ncbi:Flagellar basal-body rod protein FlgG [Aliarcobacter thereius]|uniref:Flagellar basal-body rod protein FlgG n=2 Tax=Aliarcobacter thereius TaxID=544718 RepID=A0A1C0B9A0_9BACT|nr:flagellar basal-body rod protein FlgG [Aliarcobacter thereius]OCL88722.1 Flagellar basal-body rod protein FlgG [Aliarcobacter thereius]OCL92217.1 Flagellar basal-body rod protein FlgG [Aliarcobacter thereius]OCL94687.1 Flagellar basal-body rod protein FlgG [Aliarcobacter thereius LMG 24486]OCM00133.1 Flagellar basal-body rod protein FlgG [Aliarcobacter thereius]QBF15437.1 flagellar distal rod protein FlgG, Gram-negative variant [Aliarcobacter thereius LMG 24486]
MIRGLYTAATGMNAMQHQIDVTSNNIANVNTTGFKQDRAEFQDLIYENLNYTAGQTSQDTLNPTGIDVGLGVRLGNIQKNFTEGDIKPTGNPLDVAITGRGFFQITMPNGEIAYSRNGNFKLDADGTIVNGNGYALEPQIVVPENAKDISIAKDGYVTARDPQTNDTIELGQIILADFINPAGLSPLGDSLFLQTDASGDVQEGNPTTDQFGGLSQAMLETSNVKLVNEMVDLITAQRAYEANSKAITTADSMLDTVNRLKN